MGTQEFWSPLHDFFPSLSYAAISQHLHKQHFQLLDKSRNTAWKTPEREVLHIPATQLQELHQSHHANKLTAIYPINTCLQKASKCISAEYL